MIAMIVACDLDLAIGNKKTGQMPWHCPEDLKQFKEKTIGKVIVMGRTTFESIGKPLPNRETFVVSRNPKLDYPYENVTVINDLENLLKEWKMNNVDIVICGGAQIYKESLPYIDEAWISIMPYHSKGDVKIEYPEHLTEISNDRIPVENRCGFDFFTLHHLVKMDKFNELIR